MLVFVIFLLLLVLTLTDRDKRPQLLHKPWQSWILDLSGLLCQGVIIPALQVTLIYSIYQRLLPGAQGVWDLDRSLAFLLCFIGVDYLYYWNHRLLHSSWFWPIHQVHHSATQMDVLCTSRNTLWSSFCIIYLWIHGLFLYLLSDPSGYLLGIGVTSALDLWRHSSLELSCESWFYRWVSAWLILPQDHANHHRRNGGQGLFGANFKLWDRLHSTGLPDTDPPRILGVSVRLPLWRQLFWPFPHSESGRSL